MYTTRFSLIEGVKDRHNQVAWQEFYDLYLPLIYRYGKQRGLAQADSEEIVGQCLAELAQVLPDFTYKPSRGKFRSWLKTVVNNRITNMQAQRRESLLSNSHIDRNMPDPTTQDAMWEQAWRNEVIRCCLEKVRAEVPDEHYQIFHLAVNEGWPADRIADLLNVGCEHVYRAKYKVLQKVRQRMEEYLEEKPKAKSQKPK